MALSDKDIETVFFLRLLENVNTSDEVIQACAGTRITDSRIERVRERIVARAKKLATPFKRNAEKKSIS